MQWPHGTTRYQNSRTTATHIKIIAILFRTQRIPIPYPPIPRNHCAQATEERRSGRAVKRRGQRIHRETKPPTPAPDWAGAPIIPVFPVPGREADSTPEAPGVKGTKLHATHQARTISSLHATPSVPSVDG